MASSTWLPKGGSPSGSGVRNLLCAALAAFAAAGPASASSPAASFTTEVLRGPEVPAPFRNKFKTVAVSLITDEETLQLKTALEAWAREIKAHSGRINAVPELARQTETLLALVTGNLHTCAARYRAVFADLMQARLLPHGPTSTHALACASSPLVFLDPWRDKNVGILRSMAHFNGVDPAILPCLQSEDFQLSGFNPRYPLPAQGTRPVPSTLVEDLKAVCWHRWPQAQQKLMLAAIDLSRHAQQKAANLTQAHEMTVAAAERREKDELAERKAAQEKEAHDRARRTAENKKKKLRQAARKAEAAQLEAQRLRDAQATAPTPQQLAEQAALHDQAERESEARARQAEKKEHAADLAHKQELRDLRARLAREAAHGASQPRAASAPGLAPQSQRTWAVSWDPRAEKERLRVHDQVEKLQIDAVIQELTEFGPDLLESSSSKALAGSEGLLFELRPGGGRSPWRVLYARDARGDGYTVLEFTHHDALDAAAEVAMERLSTRDKSLSH